MNHEQFYRNFSNHMEHERKQLGISQSEMAKGLDISLSTYKRIVSGDCKHIDIYLSYKVYALTQKLAYEMTDYSDDLVDAMSDLKTLSPEQLKHIRDLIEIFKKGNKL